LLIRGTTVALLRQAAEAILAKHDEQRALDQSVTFTKYVLARSPNNTTRGFSALVWKCGTQQQRLEHHAALLEFEDIQPNDESNNVDDESYMNGVSGEGVTRGAAGRVSTANGLVLFCTAVREALMRLEKARADKLASDAAAAADAKEVDANGDILTWVGCDAATCDAWFCPTCAPDESIVPQHEHSAASSTAMPAPPPLSRSSSNSRKRSMSISYQHRRLSRFHLSHYHHHRQTLRRR
jgi:hypothetical protein